jgi:uncharacterized membrane protein
MWLRRAALGLGILAVLLLLASGPGTRLGVWHFSTGFLLMRAAVYVGGAAALLGALALSMPRARQGSAVLLLAAVALGLVAAAIPLEFQRRARSAPRVNDVSEARLLQPPPREAFAKARAAAERMGWEIVAADPAAGRIDAVATTPWFGFKDDVRLQVTPQGGASRIDVRSKSRVGRGDAGTNARRIREFLKRVE